MSTSTPKPPELAPQTYADALHAYRCAVASHEETLSELAALRAENERLRSDLDAMARAELAQRTYAGEQLDHKLSIIVDRDSLRTQLARCQLDLATSRRERDEAMHAIAWLRNNRINGYDEECAWESARAEEQR